MRVNGDGTGLGEYPFPTGYYLYIFNVAISDNGSKVVYLAQRTPCCSAPFELKALNWDGSGSATQLSDYGGANTNSARIQLTADGAKVNYLGTLYNTDGSGRLELAIRGAFNPSDPPSLVNNYGLYGGSMSSGGTRFLYGADYNAGPLQMATLDLDPAGLGLAPAVTGPKIAPPYVLADGSSAAAISARVTTDQTLVRVNGVSLQDGINDSTVMNGGVILLDDDGDKVFSNSAVRASNPAPLGVRLVRMRAEVRAGDSKRHSTALDVAQLDVVATVPPYAATCTPTPTSTMAPTATWTPTPMRTPTPTPTWTPLPPDLTVSHLEVNQAIQNTQNSIPLIAFKRTMYLPVILRGSR